MRRSRTLLNLPVVSLADGQRIGVVRDLVFDCDGSRIAALLIEDSGWLTEPKVVPLDRVRSFGRNAVTVYDRQSIVPGSTVKSIRKLLNNGVLLTGLLMLTEGGNDLGTIEEVFIAPDGAMRGYEISAGVVQDTLNGKRFVPASEVFKVGPDCLIVPDHVETMILEQPADIIEKMVAAAPTHDPISSEAEASPAMTEDGAATAAA